MVRRFRTLHSDESGQALVETALVIPVLLLLAFGIVMVGRVVEAKVAVQAAAREAGRELASAPSETEGLAAARSRAAAVADGHGLDGDRLGVELDSGGFERGGTVHARAEYSVSLGDLPLLDRVEVTVASEHEERVDLYRSRETEP